MGKKLSDEQRLEALSRRDCPIRASLEVIGGKWPLLIVGHLLAGRLRYGELRRRVGDISEKMLIQELRQLEGRGLVRRIQYPEVPPRVEYELTETGHALEAVLAALWTWGQRLPPADNPPDLA